MTRWIILALLWSAAASAQMPYLPVLLKPATATYTGPGDIVSSASAWFGLRCYNAAKASAAQAMRVRRASDNTESDIGLTSACDFDAATALTFATTNATGNATSSGTAVAFTGLSGAVIAGSTITGSGFTASYCVSVGAYAAGSQTCTSNTSQTVGVAVAVTLTYALYVTKAYDQSGNGKDTAQATAANQPLLLLSCTGSLPCLVFSGAQSLSSSGTIALTQPVSSSWAGMRTGNTGSQQAMISVLSPGTTYAGFYGGTNTLGLYGGNWLVATGNDSVFHAVQSLFSGAGSDIYIDGSRTTGDAGSQSTSNVVNLGTYGGGSFLTGKWLEAGFWPSAFSNGNESSMNTNQHTYWGF